MDARPMTADEYEAGHAVCDCGEYTHVFRQCAMQRLPKDYSGEMCQRCSMWMCRVATLLAGRKTPNVADKRHGTVLRDGSA